MSSRSRWLVFLISTPIVLFVTVGGLLGAPKPTAAQDFPNRPVFEDVLSLILNAYVEPVDMEKVLAGAMRGLADTLDTSSAYLLPDEVKTIEANAPQPAGDVGLVVTRQFWLRVIGVRDGSPAARAGLQTGDFVRMIDGKPTRDLSGIAGMRLLRGAPGSKVSLSVVRGNPSDPHVFDLICRREGLTPDQVIYVGDNPRKDFVGIKPLGFRTVRILRGNYAHLAADAAHEAHRRIHSLDELTSEFIGALVGP